jgi:DnaJ like chaperone protein
MDPAAEPITMQSLFRGATHRQNLCVLALLTWVASCDGSIDDAELDLLRKVAAGVSGGGDVLPAVIDVARRGRAEDLEIACRYLRHHLPRAQRPLLAQVFVTMAARDGRLTVAENHVLRFLADLLGISPRKFAALFERVTHRPFPEVGDVSSPEWWRRREAGEQATAPAGGWGAPRTAAPGSGSPGSVPPGSPPPPAAGGGPMTRGQALQLLALREGASREEIHSAYRRMAKARHPDRFARLGPAAQASAAAAFQLVHDAYEVLTAA